MKEKQMINCPVCNNTFIPRTFYPEEAIFSTTDGKKLSGFNGYLSSTAIKPPEVILSSWATYCPNCNYMMKFVKELVRKEKVLAQNSKDVQESYKSYYFGFPYSDYSEHLKEIADKVKKQIGETLSKLRFDIWGSLHQIDDEFKFLVRFFSNLEEYCNSSQNLANQGNMALKIKKIGLPKDVEISLLQLNHIKEEIVKGDYELSSEDQEIISTILINFICFLIQKHIKPLINKSILDKEYNFIRFEDLEAEIKTYLGNYLYSNFNNDVVANRQIRTFINSFFGKIEV
jgi:thiol-disulfide isomerase/thioredoxin